ncbi:hypothetical protein DMB66_16075 [Actinoplanes sp. ATCC 53533]|nr:hypothetical protein DMB66_16075 [Actinoplanes sp. ATCC 53533]
MHRARDAAMDRAYAQPLDVAALARIAHVSPAHFTRTFRVTVPASYPGQPAALFARPLNRVAAGGGEGHPLHMITSRKGFHALAR